MDDSLVRRTAMEAGLTRLEEKHLAQLARSIETGRELSGALPRDLAWSEEGALHFRLPTPRTVPRAP